MADSEILPIRNGANFRAALPLLAASDSIEQLLKRFDEKVLRFQTFQAPKKIEEAYALLAHDDIFAQVSDLWPGPNSSDQDIKRRLSAYVRRRNQIAHEGDLESNGKPRAMQPKYATGCADFVSSLVFRLDQVVYGA